MQAYRPGVDNYAEWLAAVDAEQELMRRDTSCLMTGREIETRLAERPSRYERRLADAVAASEARSAARSTPADAFAREAAAALGAQAATIDGLRQAVAKLMVDERQRAHECEAKLERRVAELERAAGADQTRIAGLERRFETAAGVASAAETRARKIEAEATEARAQLREGVITIADDLRARVRDTAHLVGVETHDMLERKFASQLADVEERVDAAEGARAAETALTALRGQIHDDAIKLGDDLRERTRDAAAAPAAELRADVVEKFAALRSEIGEQIASLNARPASDQGQIDHGVEAAVARTRIEMHAEFDRALESRLGEKDRAFQGRIAEFDRRTVAAEERARALETVVVELRQQVCDDAIRLADDLRARTRDASVAATAELRSELESKFAARLTEAEKRGEHAEERVRTLEADLVELRVQVRDDCIRTGDDLRHRIDDATAVAGIQVRSEFESKFAARLAETEKRAERAEERARALEFAIVELRGAVRDDVAKASCDLRQQARDAAAVVAVEMREMIEARFASQLAELEKRADAAEARARAAETALTELRGEIRDDAIRVSDDLRMRVRDAATAAVTESQDAVLAAADAKIAALEGRLRSSAGELPEVRNWKPETVYYRGELVACDGALYQTKQDTPTVPGGPDWTLIAKAGRDGRDNESLTLRGAYDVNGKYARLDVIEFQGDVFLATCDSAGLCPGPDWLKLSGARGEKGERGAAGLRGHKGDRGPAGAKIVEWRVAREHFCIVPFNTDGTAGPPLRLRDLFQEFLNQTS
jgi:hypothetical protein